MLAVVLPILFGAAACSTSRIEHAELDQSVTAECPRELYSPGELPASRIVTLPAGTEIVWPSGRREILALELEVVPLAIANARENMLLQGALVYREGYRSCRSVVIYVEQLDQDLAR